MLTALLLAPRFQRVLILGLGTGSLYHFLQHHYYCRFDIVELRREVIDVARRFFSLPGPGPNLGIHCMSAEDYLRTRPQAYDLIFVDLYTETGMANALQQRAFYQSLAAVALPQAVVSINLWATQADGCHSALGYIKESFAHSRLLHVPNKGNVIALSCQTPLARSAEELHRVATRAEAQTGVEFSRIIHQLAGQDFLT